MATFTYRYRDPSGSVRSETVEAADRAGAFKALKVRGIMPLSVVDGGRPAGARRPPLRWLAAAACVLVCAVAGVFAILHGGRRGGAPEPTSGLLLLVGGAMLALRRKQK